MHATLALTSSALIPQLRNHNLQVLPAAVLLLPPRAAPAVVVPSAPAAELAAAPPGACTPSPLGYQCVTMSESGTSIHYSRGGAAPTNECTKGTSAPAGPDMLHFAVQGAATGYASLAFPQQAGMMVPSDSVIGYTDANGAPQVGLGCRGWGEGEHRSAGGVCGVGTLRWRVCRLVLSVQ